MKVKKESSFRKTDFIAVMKSIARKWVAFFGVFAITASLQAQTVPTPASSADSGGRAVIAITMPSSGDIVNTVNNAISNGEIAAGGSSDFSGKHWTQLFVGQKKCVSGPTYCVLIQGDGYLSYGNTTNLTSSSAKFAFDGNAYLSQYAGVQAGGGGCNSNTYSISPVITNASRVSGGAPTDWAISAVLNMGC